MPKSALELLVEWADNDHGISDVIEDIVPLARAELEALHPAVLPLHPHLTVGGQFKSDKYEWCPVGFFPLKFTDPRAHPMLREYADLIRETDPELSRDIHAALAEAYKLAEMS